MDNITLTKDEFESFIPAFRSPTGEVFAKMQNAIDLAAMRWNEAVKEGATVEDSIIRQIKQAVALRAAYNAVPQLDLVLTPTGFGIVSNQNTAPASRERVDSLREELRRGASDMEDCALQALLYARLLRTPERVIRSLLWTPILMRSYGVAANGGKAMYREEYTAIASALATAEARAADIISPELLAALTAALYAESEPNADRAVAIEYTRRFLAAVLSGNDSKILARSLLSHVQTHVDEFPEYKSSQTYAAQTFQRYENQSEDTTFVFG